MRYEEILSLCCSLALIVSALGVQDFDEKVQKAVNRQQSIEQTQSVLDAARQSGYQSINMDLILWFAASNVAGF